MISLFAQDLPPNELVTYDGVGCSYDYTNTTSTGRLGCWAVGSCRTASYDKLSYQYPDLSFYQWWTCQYGVVQGKGNSVLETYYNPKYYNDQAYPYGLNVNGSALVIDPDLPPLYLASTDHQDCDGGAWYGGPYDYGC